MGRGDVGREMGGGEMWGGEMWGVRRWGGEELILQWLKNHRLQMGALGAVTLATASPRVSVSAGFPSIWLQAG